MDRLLRLAARAAGAAPLPKGMSAETLRAGHRACCATPTPAPLGHRGRARRVGASRVTARRYLEHLAEPGPGRRARRGTAAAAGPRWSTAGCAPEGGRRGPPAVPCWTSRRPRRLRMSRVVHFEIQADDVERAKTFYAAVFDWSFEDYGEFTGSPYWGDRHRARGRSRASTAGCCRGPAPAPGAGQGTNGFVCTIGVGDYDETERAHPGRRRPGRPAEDGAHRDGLAGLLPRHRGQHVRHPPARPRRRLRPPAPPVRSAGRRPARRGRRRSSVPVRVCSATAPTSGSTTRRTVSSSPSVRTTVASGVVLAGDQVDDRHRGAGGARCPRPWRWAGGDARRPRRRRPRRPGSRR